MIDCSRLFFLLQTFICFRNLLFIFIGIIIEQMQQPMLIFINNKLLKYKFKYTMQTKQISVKNINKSCSYAKKRINQASLQDDCLSATSSNILNKRQYKKKNVSNSRSVSSIAHRKQSQKQISKAMSKNKIQSYSCINTNNNNDKNNDKSNDKNKNNKDKTEQLFQTIQIFHQTLSTLPLDRLILSEHPHQWVEQQSITLFKLKEKLNKIKLNQSYQYYYAKFSSIQAIIRNIHNNLAMLTKMSTLNSIPSEDQSSKGKSSYAESQLQNISGQSTQRRNSKYSLQYGNVQDKQNIMKLANKSNYKQKQLNYISEKQQIVLKNASFVNKSNPNQFQTIYSQQESEADYKVFKFNQNKSFQLSKVMDPKKTMKKNTLHKFKMQTKPKESYRTWAESTEFNQSQVLTKRSQKQTKKFQQQNQLYNKENEFNQQSRKTQNRITSSYMKLQSSIRQPTRMSEQSKMIQELQNKFINQISQIIQQGKMKQKHYIQQIYNLKEKLNQKEQSIKQLLIQDQGYQQKIQSLQAMQKQYSKETFLYLNRISTLQKSNLQIIDQIKLYKNRQSELRETVLLERHRTKSFEQKLKKLQEQLDQKQDQKYQIDLKIKQVSELLQNKDHQIKDLSHNNQILQKKQQIYRIKYFRKSSQYQILKKNIEDSKSMWAKICIKCKNQIQNSPNNKDQAKQLKQIIQFHKKKLLNCIKPY